MFFLGIAFLGIFAFSNIGVDLLPSINLPHLLVQTTYPNASPEEIEKLVTEPLEAAIGTVTGVKKITSVSKEGVSIISVDFLWGSNMDLTVLSLREKLDNIRFALPREAGRPTIVRADPSASPVVSLVLAYRREYQVSSIKKVEFRSENLEDQNINPVSGFQSPVSSSSFIRHSSPYGEIKRLIDLKEAARVIFRRRLEQLDGVAQAIVTGGLEREILIEVDPQKLDSYHITFAEIENSLKTSNVSMPAGSIMKGLFRYSLRTLGEYNNIEEIKNTIVKRNSSSTILLSDIADVKENFEEREGLTRLNGSETVGILIYKEPESNTVSISDKVKETVKILQREYPEFDLILVSDQSGFIKNAITNVKQEVLFGGVLAIFVLFFFLGSLRNVFIIGITIPSSLVLTVLLMYLFEINFNIISLGGIAVGVGMLLDNAIVVIENVVRYKEKGLTFRQAALKGSSEVAMPIVAATLTTIVVFLPLIFIKGIAGELFKDQSYAIAFSLGASIITAITLIPMLAAREKFWSIKNKEKYEKDFLYLDLPQSKTLFHKIKFWIKFPFVFPFKALVYLFGKMAITVSTNFTNFFERFYKKTNKWLDGVIDKYEILLVWALDNKRTVLLITIFLFVLTVFAAYDIKKEFIPETPQEQFIVELDYPKGTSLEGNAQITSKIENTILCLSNVQNVVSNIGKVNNFDFLNKEQNSVTKSNLIVKLDSYESYENVKDTLTNILSNLGNISFAFKQVKTTYSVLIDPTENDIEIKIKNKDIDAAYLTAEKIIDRMNKEKISGVSNFRIGVEKGTPEYEIIIDIEKCNSYGINISDVSNKLLYLVKGKEATYFSDFDKKIAINLRTIQTKRDDIDEILNEYISVNNQSIPIKNVVQVSLKESYNEVWRENQSRTIFLYADVKNISIDEAVEKIENVIFSMQKLQGQTISIGGTNEEIHNSFSKLYIALLISVFLMYMILAMEFESFLFPFIIIFSVPLGLIGGILLLYVLGESISIISIMGLIILVGIADNDAVVKVEFIMRKRREGLPVREAIIAAGKDRFRPIVMNSFTVIFALLPMIIGIGAGTQLRISLSLAIAGGLFSATFLTLIIVPVIYTYMEKWSNKKF